MKYYSLELIDINPEIDNFKFDKVSDSDLNKIKEAVKLGISTYLEFSCLEGNFILQSQFFRGIAYIPYVEPQKTVLDENIENAKEISKIEIPRKNGDRNV